MVTQKQGIKIIYRQICYLPSVVLIILALTYCVMVYQSGEASGAGAGFKNLVGIPNYYFFYLSIFPFIAAGIIYIATQNHNVRFFGSLNPEMDKDRLKKIKFRRKLLLIIAIIFSLLVAISDAADKGRTLPPYSLSFSSEVNLSKATIKFYELRDLKNKQKDVLINGERETKKIDLDEEYRQFIIKNGYAGGNITGFRTFSSWFYDSSFNYKFESFLSWLAALFVSIFVAQFFLVVSVKEHIKGETKNLVLWLLILCSMWIPCKIFSVYYYSLNEYQPPAIVWFAIVLLAISIVLAIFIKIERNDMEKYVTIIASIIAFIGTSLSIFKPEYFDLVLVILQKMGWVYSGILIFVISFTIYLITDRMIHGYEKNKI